MGTSFTLEQIKSWQNALRGLSPAKIIRWAAGTFGKQTELASSLGAEDQALLDMIAREGSDIAVFTLDTGRLFPETYDLIEVTRERYPDLPFRVLFPDSSDVESLTNTHGINLFRKSVELRRECCKARKVNPLRRALAGLDAWIVGLRREQAASRTDQQVVEWDDANGLLKISPLIEWTESQVWDYITENKVPYNVLHDRGYPSIGCACCTRAIKPGEDIRTGRWWWENPEHKECGLHHRSKQDAATR